MPVKGFVILTLEFRRDGRQWLGRCLELGTSTFARTLPQVKKELVELVELHLNTLEEAGERERFFKEHNIKFYTDEKVPSTVRRDLPLDESSFFQSHRVELPVAA